MHNFHRHAFTHWNFVGGLNLIMIFLAITYTTLYKMMYVDKYVEDEK